MSFVSKEKTAPATYKVNAAISAEDFRAALDVEFAKQLPDITLPGFRKGKAPRSMIEKRFGDAVFFEDALDALLPDAVAAALKGAELEPIFRPENLEVDELNKEQGATFSFTVIVQPEVEIDGYKGIEVEVPSADVTDEDVDARIDELRARNARHVEVAPRPAQDGDIAVIDFKGMLDGVPFDGGTSENFELKLGSGQFIPGFEEQVIGHTPGESFEVNVTFPEEYHAEHLAGQPVVFEVTLHELKAEELPPLDDDFAQEVGEDYNTVADLKKGIAEELVDSKKQAADEALDKGVQDKLVELLQGEIPQEMFDRRTQQNIDMFLERFQLSMERYAEIFGESPDALTARLAEQSTMQVKVELALEKIAALEDFVPEAEEIEAEQQRLAEQYNVPLARVKMAVPESDIVKDLNRVRALEFVKGTAIKA
ncbi:MAG: trigger factor [Oscillospiraceae bacterium]|nr:trigger factor [Oscillospiraceae bacterium]